MAGYHSFIGYPWILDCLARYESSVVKQKPVPGQVVEFLRMPDCSASTTDCQYPEAVVNISDQNCYIRAVITKEAQQTLESEDDHFTLPDIKNKIIILKKFFVCFTAAKDLRECEFYLTVQHFSVLPMETNNVDLLNCNMEPGVRKKIKELWQNYITELEANESSQDMNLSDVSLTQLLMVANEEKFSALKSVAEQCLEFDPFDIQDNLPQCTTFWSTERRNKQENTERFVPPVNLLLIPPHEEAVLEQMTEFRHEDQDTNEHADSCGEDSSLQPYSTALSTVFEEPIDEGPSQSGNPWNKLQSICVSDATSSDSQPKCPAVNEVGSEGDISTPDISLVDSPDGVNEISPFMFSENSSIQQQPSTSVQETDSTRSNTSSNHRPGGSLNTSVTSLNLIPLTQESQQRSFSLSSKVQISPVKFHMSGIKSSPARKGDLFSLSDESNREKYCSPRTRKATKRKQTPEDLESTFPDLEQQEPERVERPDCVTTASSSEELEEVSDSINGLQTAVSQQICESEATVPEQSKKKTEQPIKRNVNQNHKSNQKRIQAYKPSLQFVVNPKVLATKGSANEQLTLEGPTTSKVCTQEAPTNATHRKSSYQATEMSIVNIIELESNKLTHPDGTPFQYKNKPPSEELCASVKAIQIPADLCEWAVKMLSEHQEKLQ